MYLNDFNTEVIQNDTKYMVIYSYGDFSGTCEYELFKSGKRIKQEVLLLIKVEMGYHREDSYGFPPDK